MHDCELNYLHNFHHGGNIGNIVRVKALRYCDERAKFFYTEDIETFSVGIPIVEMKKYLNLNYNYICSKYGKNQFIKHSEPAFPDDIRFNETQNKKKKNYIVRQNQVKKQVKDIMTIKTSTTSLKDERTITKNFILKIKNQRYINILLC